MVHKAASVAWFFHSSWSGACRGCLHAGLVWTPLHLATLPSELCGQSHLAMPSAWHACLQCRNARHCLPPMPQCIPPRPALATVPPRPCSRLGVETKHCRGGIFTIFETSNLLKYSSMEKLIIEKLVNLEAMIL